MYIRRISLENFRSYQSLTLDLAKGTHIFYGKNGEGKTNIVEAIFLCAIGRSFRAGKDAEMIRNGEEFYRVCCEIDDDVTENIELRYTRKGEKAVRVNGLFLRKIGHLMGSLLAVIFSPEDLQLLHEGPMSRRRLMDIAISQLYPMHYFGLLQYNKALAQKNMLLRNPSFGSRQSSSALLDVYNEQLCRSGAGIIVRRGRFTGALREISVERNREISGGEALDLRYASDLLPEDFTFADENAEEQVFALLQAQLEQKKSREIERMQALYGPHRDDLLFTLNGDDLKRFGSQGQKRTAVLSVKLAELEILKSRTGRMPVLLLDDVFSELDGARQAALLRCIRGFQTVVTCTDIREIPKEILQDAATFHVCKAHETC